MEQAVSAQQPEPSPLVNVQSVDVPAGTLADRILTSREFHRTIRFAIVSTAVVVGMGIAVWGIVRIKQTETWWTSLLETAAIIAAFWKPARAAVGIQTKFQKYMETDHQRVTRIEQSVDPNRTSTGLNSDGTSPHGI